MYSDVFSLMFSLCSMFYQKIELYLHFLGSRWTGRFSWSAWDFMVHVLNTRGEINFIDRLTDWSDFAGFLFLCRFSSWACRVFGGDGDYPLIQSARPGEARDHLRIRRNRIHLSRHVQKAGGDSAWYSLYRFRLFKGIQRDDLWLISTQCDCLMKYCIYLFFGMFRVRTHSTGHGVSGKW